MSLLDHDETCIEGDMYGKMLSSKIKKKNNEDDLEKNPSQFLSRILFHLILRKQAIKDDIYLKDDCLCMQTHCSIVLF